jgi:hypothetical protein
MLPRGRLPHLARILADEQLRDFGERPQIRGAALIEFGELRSALWRLHQLGQLFHSFIDVFLVAREPLEDLRHARRVDRVRFIFAHHKELHP